MRLSVREAEQRFPDRSPPAPLKYANQWVAWNAAHSRIVAHGEKFGEVLAAANATGCREPLMQRVLDTEFVGGA